MRIAPPRRTALPDAAAAWTRDMVAPYSRDSVLAQGQGSIVADAKSRCVPHPRATLGDATSTRAITRDTGREA
ncbi:hypothetical protein [Paracraurococcus ruber]|uniref:Uncharacterized protein n=1 Tax=Paracraurococcus ruber TaxID=77675 RepID=A0ABS1CVV9_9PROT|nr:hypothetical protein [Paracraurococcus ruber]MBK1658513.1 hypothetical protein [Paracraurococcus ruber]TDG32503.1 hypothetical protein E2C05_06995 [Paracraurococcus ruber]